MTVAGIFGNGEIDHLLSTYGYAAVFLIVGAESIGIPVPGETTLTLAAIYAGATHQLNIAGVITAAAAGARAATGSCVAMATTSASTSTA